MVAALHALACLVYRYGFRWIMMYWLCFTITLPLDLIQLPAQMTTSSWDPDWIKSTRQHLSTFSNWVEKKKNECIIYVGKEYLDVAVVIKPTGSGDTRRNYVGCFCALVLATGLAALWSILSEMQRAWRPAWQWDEKLHVLVRIWLRFFLIKMLFSYGFGKVFPMQFPEPRYLYDQPFGDLQPMSLLWAFMGHSTPYQIITGSVEVLAGLLLISRYTTLLGALLTVMAMTQVFILNMCYDVPVKLYSFHYLLMGLFLAAPDVPRLVNFFVLGRPAAAQNLKPYFAWRWLNWLGMAFKWILVGCWLWTQISWGYRAWTEQQAVPANLITGKWETVAFELGGKKIERQDPVFWTKLDFSNNGNLIIEFNQAPKRGYTAKFSTENKLTLHKTGNYFWFAVFQYQLKEPDQLVLEGTMDEKKIVATLKRLPDKKYILPNKGFHWIHEFPRD